MRAARPHELAVLPTIEAASDELFAEHGIGPLPRVVTTVDELGRAAGVLVAGDPVVGFARLEVVGGESHLEQLSVHPAAARRGVGGALVEAAAEWAALTGHDSLTLCTFADVPWNMPFYLRHGFEVVEDLGPSLHALRASERRIGLDGLGQRVVMRRRVGPEAVLADLTAGLTTALGDHLVGLYAHGSLVYGDFAPARSDLDVLAVVARPPDEAMLAAVAPVHAALVARHPAWRGRIEVETCARSTVEMYATGGHSNVSDRIMRISPGEALHLLPATPHRVVTWAGVRNRGRALAGPPAVDVLPAIGRDVVRAAFLAHVRDWPLWVEDMRTVGGQAYSVLSLCRAWCLSDSGEQLSKRAAADRAAEGLPRDAPLVTWARDWWYAGGGDDEPDRHAEVQDFVRRTSLKILHDAGPATG